MLNAIRTSVVDYTRRDEWNEGAWNATGAPSRARGGVEGEIVELLVVEWKRWTRRAPERLLAGCVCLSIYCS